MKKALFFIGMLLTMTGMATAQSAYKLGSPNGDIQVTVTVSDQIRYDIACQQEPLLQQGLLQLELGKEVLGQRPKVTKSSTTTVDETIRPVVPLRFSTIANRYNRLLLHFRGGYAVEFRAFDDGVAYRFITQRKGTVDVTHERFELTLPADYRLHGQLANSFQTAYEEPYRHLTTDEWAADNGKYTLLPLLIEANGNRKILISETDLTDYPAMFLTPAKDKGKITSAFPKNPIEFGEAGDRYVSLQKEAEYIARTRGNRTFPWRYFVITANDGQLLETTMATRLAPTRANEDISWIQPGVTIWDWWNGNALYGPDVDFVAGCNTATAKYYIDFARKFGLSYILLDEGWAKDTRDPFVPNDRLDLQEVIRYAKEQNIGVILWLPWLTVEKHPELFSRLAEWGIKGLKIDFMDRSDQWMVNFYERVAAEAARHKLVIDFHGSFKPAGLEYKYPNILSYEGVRGMEHMQNCRPDNTIYIPFIRNVVGPMDFTPGAMQTYQPDKYPNTHRPNASHMGTRAYQMATFVLFESGLQMMADTPTLYLQQEDCARFMAGVPVTTDETVALAAKVGEYVVVAKRKGEKWYIGGITNGTERTLELPLDFLKKGTHYQMTSYEDGPNANRMPMHYVKHHRTVTSGQTLTVHLARNGGIAAMLEKAE